MNTLGTLATAAVFMAAVSPASPRAKSQATINIDAPLEMVWMLVVDIDHWPKWNKAVETAHLEGPVAVGSVFKWRSGGLRIRSAFQEIVPMQRLSWTGQTIGTSAIHSWEFKPTEQGLVVTTTESFNGWLPAILPGTMQKKLDDALPALLLALKLAAEHDALQN